MMLTMQTLLTRRLLLAATAGGGAHQRRGTVIVARKHEVDRPYPELDGRTLAELDDYPDRVPVHSKLYETVELLATRPDQQLLRVRLSQDVPGLGESGQTVEVHRSRYWHYLHPLGWARIATKEAAADAPSAERGGSWRDSRVFAGPMHRLQLTLEAMHLLVPIGREAAAASGADFQLSERHICVAFRRYGVEVPRHAVRLPSRLPTPGRSAGRGASAAAQQQQAFRVGVQLNSRVTVQVKASLHLMTLGEAGSGLPPVSLPSVQVDDWLAEMYPQPSLPSGARVFERYLLQQGPPDFERILGSNRSRVKK